MFTTSMRPTQTLIAIAALTALSACSMFKVKPATPAPAPAPAPTQPVNRPANQPATTPANQPTNRPAGTQPTTPATTPTTQPAPTTQGTAQGTPPRTAAPTTPATTPASTPATTPAATPPAAPRLTQDQIEANRIKDDSTRLASLGRTRRYSPVYFTLMFDAHGAKMRTAHNGVLGPEEEPGQASIELALQKANGGGLGVAVRSIGSADAYEYNEFALLMGSRKFALDLGVATRTGFDSLNLNGGGAYDSTYIFPRVGFRSRANLGGTDFSAQFRALYYVPLPSLDEALPESEFEGWSAETGLSWTWNKFPLTANLGYRIERFKVFGREMETSSLVIGGGLLLGRRPRPPAPAAPAESVSAPVTPPPGNAQTTPPRRP